MQKTIMVTMVAMQLVLGAARLDAQTAQPAPSARQSSDESGIVAGIKGGVNVARLSNEEEGDSRIGVIAGAWIARRLSGVIGLQLEGLYSEKATGRSTTPSPSIIWRSPVGGAQVGRDRLANERGLTFLCSR